ncbi:hypothetical protein T265_09534 [Opisthorchis viverrini]|uniref:Uncharacterized protein n=1 Tax=Opisthorchis viverrini TaxID=6198 RepID=A0A074ZGI7_OPIVI|nr:hypothetical protein T265_09534 [Opisthorchis viverrini]KER22365.1 hypothetical protein T265_09534 [Opisthorchis viverrini]
MVGQIIRALAKASNLSKYWWLRYSSDQPDGNKEPQVQMNDFEFSGQSTKIYSFVVDQMAVDLFAELGNWPANVSPPYEETSSVRGWLGTSSLPACVYIAVKGHLLSSDVIGYLKCNESSESIVPFVILVAL